MRIVGVHEAKTHLSRLLERVQEGEEILIAKGGKPYARLVPVEQPKRQPGTLKGVVHVGPEFFEELPEDWTGEA